MKKIDLGKIEQVDVREIWDKEDTDFTPWLAKDENIKRVVTLSPQTPMATHFHISHGAKQININKETQNFEYNLQKK